MLKQSNEEVKRLEWLNKKINHSYGLKKRHSQCNPKTPTRQRSKSTGRRTFVKEGIYQDWTNTFARKTTQWDSTLGLLEQEKPRVPSVKKLKRNPTNCCGNSPGKERTGNHEMIRPADFAVPMKSFARKSSLTSSRLGVSRSHTGLKTRKKSKSSQGTRPQTAKKAKASRLGKRQSVQGSGVVQPP